MTPLEQLGPLPPITVELDLFDYVPLDTPGEPPPVELRARLARSYNTAEEDGEGLRLAFVAGHPVDSHDPLVLAYLWRAAPKTSCGQSSVGHRRSGAYGLPARPDVRNAGRRRCSRELKRLGPASLANDARVFLAS
jgi:hypothetical protein